MGEHRGDVEGPVLTALEAEAFGMSRTLIGWRRGERKRLKRAYWRRTRHRLRQKLRQVAA
jgi:hypothetical protein